MRQSLYTRLASLVLAIRNCEKTGNGEWLEKHGNRADSLVRQHMPSGSGFDRGTALDIEASNAEKLVFYTWFHHMDEHGSYDGWTEHVVTVKASLAYGFTVTVSGRDRNGIKEFIADTFNHCGSIQVEA